MTVRGTCRMLLVAGLALGSYGCATPGGRPGSDGAGALSREQADGAETARDAGEGAKRDDIRRLMKLTGAAELGKQVVVQLVANMRTTMPKVPAAFWDEFLKQVQTDEMTELAVAVYDRHFTHDEIRELIRFYQTPTGRKVVKEMPLIAQESMKVGQAWGLELGKRAWTRLKERRYL